MKMAERGKIAAFSLTFSSLRKQGSAVLLARFATVFATQLRAPVAIRSHRADVAMVPPA
jgi:hypothetical protein